MKVLKTSEREQPQVRRLSKFESICEKLNPFVITLKPGQYEVLS